jgi:chemotaxis protein MotB
MGKKHKHPEHENLERWLVSYADFITLLFATFVVLYALSQADLAKFKNLSVALKQAFNPGSAIMQNPGGVMKGTPQQGVLKESGNSILDKVKSKSAQNDETKGTASPVVTTVKQITKTLSKTKLSSKIKEALKETQVNLQERGVVISFSNSLFFDPGSATLKSLAFPILDKVATDLANNNRLIHVEGHTDNHKISTALYPSNWELSSARSSSVIRYLIERDKLDPKRLAAIGYGDTRPIADNSTEAGRQKNRRIDIVLLFSEAEKVADSGEANKTEQTVFSGEGEGGIGVPDRDSSLAPIITQQVPKVATHPTASQPTPTAQPPSKGPFGSEKAKSKHFTLIKPIEIRPDKLNLFKGENDNTSSDDNNKDKQNNQSKKSFSIISH